MLPLSSNNPFNQPHLLYLSRSDIQAIDQGSTSLYLNAVRRAMMLHAQGRYVQPLKPYLRPANDAHIADRIIVMPAYLLDEKAIAGVKIIGSKHTNPSQHHLPRANGVIVLMNAETHVPIAVMDASHISGMRTAAITSLAAQYLARPYFESVACIGCGPIAKMQLSMLLNTFDSVRSVRLFDLNPAASDQLVTELSDAYPSVQVIDFHSAQAAIANSHVVVTCTIAEKPYIPFEWLSPGTFVSNISIQDLFPEVFLKADKVLVDDWQQANREGKVLHQLYLKGQFSQDSLHSELSEVVTGLAPGRESNDEIIVLNPMGMAIEDIACAQAIFESAHDLGILSPLH